MKGRSLTTMEYRLLLVFVLVVVILLLMLLIPPPDPEEVLASCFRTCEKNWGDHDNNPDTPMLNAVKYNACIAECCEAYRESQ